MEITEEIYDTLEPGDKLICQEDLSSFIKKGDVVTISRINKRATYSNSGFEIKESLSKYSWWYHTRFRLYNTNKNNYEIY